MKNFLLYSLLIYCVQSKSKLRGLQINGNSTSKFQKDVPSMSKVGLGDTWDTAINNSSVNYNVTMSPLDRNALKKVIVDKKKSQSKLPQSFASVTERKLVRHLYGTPAERNRCECNQCVQECRCGNADTSASCISCCSNSPGPGPSTSSCTMPNYYGDNIEVGNCPYRGGELNSNYYCDVQCDSGYDARGSARYSCSNGYLTRATLTCSPPAPSYCSLPNYFNNHVNGASPYPCSQGQSLPTGHYCLVQCDTGYSGTGSNRYSCSSGGYLTEPSLTCTASSCLLPSSFGSHIVGATQYGCVKSSSLPSGYECSVQCDAGYDESGTRKYSCNDGILSYPTLTCAAPPPASCTLPNYFNNRITGDTCTEGEILDSGDSCTVACQTKYISGTKEYSCNDGTLTNPTLTCTAPAPPVTCICAGGKSNPNPNAEKCQYYPVDKCTTCCQSSLPCSLPTSFGSHIIAVTQYGCVESSSLSSGNQCSVQCDSGYDGSGSTTYSCLDGHLTTATLTCTAPSPCSLPSVFGSHIDKGSCTADGSLGDGETCIVKCDVGCGSKGDGTYLCNDGTLEQATLKCTLLPPPPPLPPNPIINTPSSTPFVPPDNPDNKKTPSTSGSTPSSGNNSKINYGIIVVVLLSVSFIAVGCVVKRRDISKEDSDNDIEIPLIPPIRVPSTDSETDSENDEEKKNDDDYAKSLADLSDLCREHTSGVVRWKFGYDTNARLPPTLRKEWGERNANIGSSLLLVDSCPVYDFKRCERLDTNQRGKTRECNRCQVNIDSPGRRGSLQSMALKKFKEKKALDKFTEKLRTDVTVKTLLNEYYRMPRDGDHIDIKLNSETEWKCDFTVDKVEPGPNGKVRLANSNDLNEEKENYDKETFRWRYSGQPRIKMVDFYLLHDATNSNGALYFCESLEEENKTQKWVKFGNNKSFQIPFPICTEGKDDGTRRSVQPLASHIIPFMDFCKSTFEIGIWDIQGWALVDFEKNCVVEYMLTDPDLVYLMSVDGRIDTHSNDKKNWTRYRNDIEKLLVKENNGNRKDPE